MPPRALLALAVAVLATALTGCTTGGSGAGRWDSQSIGRSIEQAPFTPVVVNSNLGAERTRLDVALLARDQTLVADAAITMRLYRLDDDPEQHPFTAKPAGSYDLTRRQVDLADGRPNPIQTMYTTMVNLDHAGRWGADLDVRTGGRDYKGLRLTMLVQPHTEEPGIGDSVPRSKQRILGDGTKIEDIDSATPPNPALHDTTVGDAIGTGQPVVIAFVTPQFCQTRYCGPTLNQVVLPAWKAYRDRVKFIHIEPYDVPAARRGALIFAPTTTEWKLRTEPWLVVIGRDGKVTTKLEGIIAPEELTQALDAALGTKQ